MRHSKKKSEQTRLPEQDAMGSADDYAPGGATSQGDGQADGPTFTDTVETANAPAAPNEADSVADASVQQDTGADRERYLRLAAEYDNYRKRAARERTEAGARAQADLVRELIDALDDVARFAHVDPATTDAATVVQGVDMVEKKLLKALGNAGLEVINPVGETFDPAVQEAVATEPTSAREDDHVVSRVYQPGYVFKGQLLRPARVVVKQWNG